MRPYSYQATCLSALATARSGGSDKELVVMATGLGKTMVAAFDIKRLLEKAPGRVLYLCHQNHILAQARKTFEKVLGSGYSFGNFHGTEKHLHEVDVLFASFQTMANWREAFLRDEFRYVVVDEVHHAQAETFRPTVQYFMPDFKLGLTATVKRTDGLDVGELFNGEPVFELDLYEALARKYLCDVDYRIMTDEIQTAGVLDTPVGKLSIAHLNRTIFIPKRDEEIARIIGEKTAHIQNPRVMVFCTTKKHAENMAALIPGAKHVHSGVKAQEKDDRLAAFRSGTLTTVTTIDMFNEGIDVPEANVIVFLRSTASETIYLQQFGRGLRKADGKDNVLVLDFVANCERIEMVRELDARVRQFREEMAQETAVEASSEVADDSEPHGPLILTLDGVEFDERTWKLFEVIEGVRAQSQPLSDDDLIVNLARYALQLGRLPSQSDLEAGVRPEWVVSTSAHFRRFGGLMEAKRLATEWLAKNGHNDPRYQPSNQDDDDLIANLVKYAKELGRLPGTSDMKPGVRPEWVDSYAMYHRRFGFTRAKQLVADRLAGDDAGVQYVAPASTDEGDLIANLARYAVQLERLPVQSDLEAGVRPNWVASVVTYTARFGGLTEAKRLTAERLAEMGYNSPQYQLPSLGDDDLIASLARYALQLGRLPNQPDLESGVRPEWVAGRHSYVTRFGGLTEAKRLATEWLAKNGHSLLSNDERLIADLASYAKQLGRLPVWTDMKADVRPKWVASLATYASRFGWSNAQSLASEHLAITDQRPDALRGGAITLTANEESTTSSVTKSLNASDLLTQVLTKAKSLGRPPRAGEVDADPAMASAKEVKAALRASNWAEVIGHIKPYL